jgi:hypothetical protein
LPQAQLSVERRIRLTGRTLEVVEAVENVGSADRPIAWTEHVTLGPPFLEKGVTEFRASVTQSHVLEEGCGDFRRYTGAPVSNGFTTHLMNPARDTAYFVAWSPRSRLALAYVWHQADFPWLGVWEENYSRQSPPWNGRTLTRGMEFGASPMPETRRQMIGRGTLFGVPAFRWIPARTRVEVHYRAVLSPADNMPEALAIVAAGEDGFDH